MQVVESPNRAQDAALPHWDEFAHPFSQTKLPVVPSVMQQKPVSKHVGACAVQHPYVSLFAAVQMYGAAGLFCPSTNIGAQHSLGHCVFVLHRQADVAVTG